MSKPTPKASLESAAMGLSHLRTLIHGMSDGAIDDIIDIDEAIRLDKAVHSLLEYAEEQKDG